MKLYRAIVINLCDEEDYLKSTIYIDYTIFNVIRETNNFFVIKIDNKEKKVGKNSKAQFASTSQEKALINAWHRNIRHKSILNSRLEYAKRVNNFLREQINHQK